MLRLSPVVCLPLLLMSLPVLLAGCGSDKIDSSPPELVVTPDAFVRESSYGQGSPPGSWVRIRNGGDGVLGFDAFLGEGQWCRLYDDGQVDVVNSVAPDSFAVTFSTGTLEPGVYYDTLWIQSPHAVNSPVAVPVTLTMNNVIEWAPDSLTFRMAVGTVSPASQQLRVGSASSTSLTYALSSSSSWLSYDPTGGVTPGVITVSLNNAQLLPPGIYRDTIVVQAATALTPGKIPVRLEIASWLKTNLGSSYDLAAVHFANSQTGMSAGKLSSDATAGFRSLTFDGGVTWDTALSQTGNPIPALGDIWFADDRQGWVVGRNASIYHTDDSGATWSLQDAPDTLSAGLNAVHFVNTQVGWAVGSHGVIIHTGDGGATWERQPSGTSSLLSGVWFVDESQGWAVGNYGMILATTNGGLSWQAQDSGLVQDDLWDVTFPTATDGWAVGDAGLVLHTSNGGEDWSVHSRPTAAILRSVAFVAPGKGWAVGSAGTIMRIDDGLTWRPQASGVSVNLQDVFFIDENEGWICGSQGVLLHTLGGGE